MKKALSVLVIPTELAGYPPTSDERVSIFNLYSDYIRRVRKNQGDTRFPTNKITISWTDIQHSSRRADAAGALLLVVLLQGFLGLPCLHLLLSADD